MPPLPPSALHRLQKGAALRVPLFGHDGHPTNVNFLQKDYHQSLVPTPPCPIYPPVSLLYLSVPSPHGAA